MIEVVCAQCGKPFLGQYKNRKFCSNNCRRKTYVQRHTPLVDRTCDVCGTMFHQNKRHQRYCSSPCYLRAFGIQNREKLNAKQRERTQRLRALRPPKQPLQCAGCGAFFVPKKRQKSCSMKCNSKIYVANNRAAANKWRDKYAKKVRIRTPWQHLLMQCRARAKKAGLPFSLDAAWAQQTWNGACAVSGIPFILDGGPKHPFSPSIDQIRPGKGYTPGNVRFVLWAVNVFKYTWDDAVMFTVANAIAVRLSSARTN